MFWILDKGSSTSSFSKGMTRNDVEAEEFYRVKYED